MSIDTMASGRSTVCRDLRAPARILHCGDPGPDLPGACQQHACRSRARGHSGDRVNRPQGSYERTIRSPRLRWYFVRHGGDDADPTTARSVNTLVATGVRPGAADVENTVEPGAASTAKVGATVETVLEPCFEISTIAMASSRG